MVDLPHTAAGDRKGGPHEAADHCRLVDISTDQGTQHTTNPANTIAITWDTPIASANAPAKMAATPTQIAIHAVFCEFTVAAHFFIHSQAPREPDFWSARRLPPSWHYSPRRTTRPQRPRDHP